MGLNDAADDAKERFEKISDEDVEEFEEAFDELQDRISLLSQMIIALDGEIESLSDELQSTQARLKALERENEGGNNNESQETGFLDGSDDGPEGDSDGQYSWNS